jgi:low temperature requirement protein LtrA
MAAGRDRWRRLWRPPRPHGQQPLDRSVSPVELFYDLVVVVLVGQAAHHLSGHLTWRGLAEFTAVFTLIWIAWLNGSLHHDLHGHDDARGRTTLLVQILVLVPLGASIPGAGGARGAAFAANAAILFAILALLWRRAARDDTADFRRSSLVFVAGTVVCAAVLAGTILLPPDARLIAWLVLGAAYLAGFSVMIGLATPVQAAAFTITDAIVERFGLFIIIVLGETVIGVVGGLADAEVGPLTLAVGLVAVVLGFGAWWTYFDFAGRRKPRQTRSATVLWMFAHLPLAAAVAAMGAAMVPLVEHAHDRHGPAPAVWLLSTGTAVTLCATMALAASLQAWRANRALYRPLVVTCAVVAVLCPVLAAVQPAPLLLVGALVVLLAIPWGVAVTRSGTSGDSPTG